jgi:hypothetical protein
VSITGHNQATDLVMNLKLSANSPQCSVRNSSKDKRKIGVNNIYRFVAGYINIIIKILDIIHNNVFYLKHKVSETGFCLRLQVEPTQLGPIERGSRPN